MKYAFLLVLFPLVAFAQDGFFSQNKSLSEDEDFIDAANEEKIVEEEPFVVEEKSITPKEKVLLETEEVKEYNSALENLLKFLSHQQEVKSDSTDNP